MTNHSNEAVMALLHAEVAKMLPFHRQAAGALVQAVEKLITEQVALITELTAKLEQINRISHL